MQTQMHLVLPEKQQEMNIQCSCQNDEIPVKAFSSRYQMIHELGSGSFGTVSLYKMKQSVFESQKREMHGCPGTLLNPLSVNYKYSNELVAIKTMNKKLKRNSDYSKVKEIQFIFSVDSHFNLVQIIDVFIDRTYFKLNIVMENMDQNLYQLMKSRRGNVFSPRTLKSVLSQLLSAILHIHNHLFFHRDVKPENILVMQNLNYFGPKQNIPPNQRKNSYIIKLADYGLARHSSNERQFTAYVSTRWYRSPEILFRQCHYSFPIDIWAFGCVAVECAMFTPLFPGKNELDQCCKIMDFLGNPTKAFQLNALQQQNSNFKYNNYNGYNYNYGPMTPFGGFWEEGKELATKLGLMFPKHFGYRLENLIIRKDFDHQERINFFDMVKSCLTWDPCKRATALGLVHSSYFENSITVLEHQKENEINIDPNIIDNSKINTVLNKGELKDNINRSLMFAGISPNKIQNTKATVKPINISTNLSNKNSNKSIKISPGLGIQNKFNIVNVSNMIPKIGKDNIVSSRSNENQTSFMQLTSDSIDEFVNIFPDNPKFSDIEEFHDNVSHLYNIDPKGSTNNNKDQIEFKFEDYNENLGISDANNDDDDDDNEEEDDDDDDEFDLDENALLPMELGKVQTFLQESQDGVKIQDSNVSIKNNYHGNYDLIDAIDYALDDELNVKHQNYSWEKKT